ncbi:UNVERIFIED_CONTAM: hypothetical protein Scaly_0127400 [Sesamum calycinum]|uniref:Uncharacterized protein n=3 Tax=Sesamum TaxID=4181 RepID=A0AAE2C608_9LAMI|nr:hypothetical protein Sango_0104600 [Sesamum angolense]
MSFSGGKRPLYSSSLALLLLLISLVHIWVSGQTTAEAIRILAEEGQSMEPPPPAPGKNQTEIFREYFNSRLSDLNSTTTNATFVDYKRRIPSCPDPLHN